MGEGRVETCRPWYMQIIVYYDSKSKAFSELRSQGDISTSFSIRSIIHPDSNFNCGLSGRPNRISFDNQHFPLAYRNCMQSTSSTQSRWQSSNTLLVEKLSCSSNEKLSQSSLWETRSGRTRWLNTSWCNTGLSSLSMDICNKFMLEKQSCDTVFSHFPLFFWTIQFVFIHSEWCLCFSLGWEQEIDICIKQRYYVTFSLSNCCSTSHSE